MINKSVFGIEKFTSSSINALGALQNPLPNLQFKILWFSGPGWGLKVGSDYDNRLGVLMLK